LGFLEKKENILFARYGVVAREIKEQSNKRNQAVTIDRNCTSSFRLARPPTRITAKAASVHNMLISFNTPAYHRATVTSVQQGAIRISPVRAYGTQRFQYVITVL